MRTTLFLSLFFMDEFCFLEVYHKCLGLGAKDNLDSHRRGTSREEFEFYFKHPPNDETLFLEDNTEFGKPPISSTILKTTLHTKIQQYSPTIDGSISRLRIEN
jgi:hypothetical protein